MDAIFAWYTAHHAAVLQIVIWLGAGAQLFNSLVPATFGPAWLHAIVGRIAAFDKDGHFSIPLIQGNTRKPCKLPPLAPPAALFLPFVCVLFASCSYCQQAANKNTAECKAYAALVACGPQALAIVANDLGDLVAGDVAKLLSDVMQQIPAEYDCVANAIKDAIAKKFGVNSPEYAKFLAADGAMRAKAKAGGK
ncbi:MAG TPA: hypothetical protein VLV86_12015 [Vicinamibacterales bacterium]|nr:hypothetical protein [Vicinamibacterales bacterium]